jgi:hypothetical protein
VCRREAPAVEQFARQHADTLRVVGLGTQDTLGEAEEFRDAFDMTEVTMLWDESFESWSAFGVRSQPAAILFDARGKPLQAWLGPFDEAEALDLARNA